MLIDTGITIDGTDITPYIAHQGVKWTRADVDGPNAGRSISGLMIRDRVATKIRLDITCRPLKNDELRILLNLLLPEFVSVRYDDPMYGVVTKTMYANNNPATFLFKRSPEVSDLWWTCHDEADKPQPFEYWHQVTFPLVER